MKRYPFFIFLFVLCDAMAQAGEPGSILTEGRKLYRSEMASWYGTDIFLEKFADKRARMLGYVSYTQGEQAICIFFSKDQPAKVLGEIRFDSTYNVNTAIVNGVERDLDTNEQTLVIIRTKALEEYKTDHNLFKSYKDMNPNFIPLSDEDGKRVYVLTGPQNQGVVVFGNDYLLTFNGDNELVSKRQLHKNLIQIQSPDKGKVALTTMHTHLPETGEFITATDICTLMLYCPFTSWKQHIVISNKQVSIWDCQKGLATLPREAWEKIGKKEK